MFISIQKFPARVFWVPGNPTGRTRLCTALRYSVHWFTPTCNLGMMESRLRAQATAESQQAWKNTNYSRRSQPKAKVSHKKAEVGFASDSGEKSNLSRSAQECRLVSVNASPDDGIRNQRGNWMHSGSRKLPKIDGKITNEQRWQTRKITKLAVWIKRLCRSSWAT